jgi:hypothetical protein
MTNRSRITTWAAAPLFVGALTLASCGSDDDADSTPAAVTSADVDAEPASDEATGGGDFCAALGEYAADVSDDAISDPAELEQLASIAPSEIADDMQSLAELTSQMIDFDEMTASEDEIAEFESLITEFGPVSARLDAWTIENCPELVID